MVYQDGTNLNGISKYIVTPGGGGSPYKTIQSAVTAANAEGGDATVFIRHGTFTEDLTLFDGIFLEGSSEGGTIIVGTHTLPTTGTVNYRKVEFQSATDVFNSAVAGTTTVLIEDCIFNVTNGFVFDLPNWTGTISVFDISSTGTNDGFMNNTGGANVFLTDAALGMGAGQTMVVSGTTVLQNVFLSCPITCQGTGTTLIGMGSQLNRLLTTAATNTVTVSESLLSTGANVAISHGSANGLSLANATVSSSNATPIGGVGAGVVAMSGVSFPDSSAIAGTVTTSAGIVRGGNFISQYVVGTSPDAQYQTIQAAINAANTAGGNETIYVKNGTYTENLTLYDGINVIGATGLGDEGQVEIIGVHTPPTTGNFVFRNFRLTSATDIFNSAAAGTARLVVIDATVVCTNGYLFNLVNWAAGGILEMFDVNSAGGTNDGGINNTGGCQVYIYNAGIGTGNGNSMVLSGTTILFGAGIGCPISCQGAGTTRIDGSTFPYTLTTAATNTVSITGSRLTTGATTAITHGSASAMELSDVTIDSAHATAIGGAGAGAVNFGSVTFLDSNAIAGTITQTLTSILKTGEVHAENIQNSDCSGIEAWGGAGAYYSLAATDLTVERAGSGYVRGKLVNWLGSQATGALAIGNTHFIYMDETGTIGSTTTRNFALFRDNIVLFEVLVDPNSVVTVVREDHPYNFSTAISDWAHDTIGTVIANLDQGANIALNGTKAIQIDGADELEDHGLETDIPDSAAAAVDFVFMFTNGAGKWEIDSTANTFASEYNNAGVVAALGGNKYGVFRLYVSKDDLNTATPVYYAVLHTAQYNNLTAAQTAVALGTPARATNELAELEMAQLGFVIKEQSSDNIVDVIIEKSVGGGSTSLVSPGVASLVATDVTNFNGWLGAGDTTSQAAFETLDDVGLTVTPEHSVLLAGATLAIASTGVLTDGQLVIGSTGLAPAVAAPSNGNNITWTLGAGTLEADLTGTTDHTVQVGNATGSLTSLAAATDGQLIIGSTGADPAVAALASAGATVTITNGAGTINLEAVSGGILTWAVETGATKTAVVNQGYITNRGGGVVYTIPTTAAVGSIIRIAGLAGLWTIAQNAAESIVFGIQTTTVGVGGSLVATNAGDAIEILCIVADTTWTVLSSVGNITVN